VSEVSRKCKKICILDAPFRRRLAFAASFDPHRFTMHLQDETTGAAAMIRANRKML
jgi:hypothetical protein